jgi:hypothetical protein
MLLPPRARREGGGATGVTSGGGGGERSKKQWRCGFTFTHRLDRGVNAQHTGNNGLTHGLVARAVRALACGIAIAGEQAGTAVDHPRRPASPADLAQGRAATRPPCRGPLRRAASARPAAPPCRTRAEGYGLTERDRPRTRTEQGKDTGSHNAIAVVDAHDEEVLELSNALHG